MKRQRSGFNTQADDTLEVIQLWSRGKHREAADAVFAFEPNRANAYVRSVVKVIHDENPGAVLGRFMPQWPNPEMVTAEEQFEGFLTQFERYIAENGPLYARQVEQALQETARQESGTLLGEYIRFLLAKGATQDAYMENIRNIMIPAAQAYYASALDDTDPDRLPRTRYPAEHGNAVAIEMVWWMTEGDGTTTESERTRMLERLVSLGDANGTRLSAVAALQKGDFAKYFGLATLAASIGSVEAFKHLADTYSMGIAGVVTQDVKLAKRWYVRGGELGSRADKITAARKFRARF